MENKNENNSEYNEVNSEASDNIAENNDAELHEIMYGSEYDSYREDLGQEGLEENGDDRLSTFTSVTEVKQTRSSVLSKQTKLIIILSAVFAAVLTLVLVLGPVGFDVFGFKEQPQESLELIEGEVAISPTRHLVFEHIERENLQRIEVHNEYGTYTAYYNKEFESFYFLGAEDAPYDENLFSSLVVSAGYTLMKDRLSHEERSSDYSEYGLGANDDPAYYIIQSREGKTYKMYIGDALLDNSGYYAMLDGRDEIYVLSSSLESTIMADVKTLLVPLLTYPIDNNDYLTEIFDFSISRNSEAFVRFSYTDETTAGVTIPFTISYPKYFPCSTVQIQTLLSSAVNITGEEILETDVYMENGKDDKGETIYVLKPDIAKKYELDKPAYDLFYYYTENKLLSFVTFSAKQTDENGKAFYYALSQTYNTIVKIDASKVAFLEWELVDYIERSIFNYHIDYVESIELHTPGEDGKHYDFNLTGSGENLNVSETYSGRLLKPNPPGTSKDVFDDIKNFRQFYKTSLTVESEDFIEKPTEDKKILAEMKVTFRNMNEGEAIEDVTYIFYSVSDRHCYYTVNGEGEFYIARSALKKLLTDAQNVIDKVPIVYDAES